MNLNVWLEAPFSMRLARSKFGKMLQRCWMPRRAGAVRQPRRKMRATCFLPFSFLLKKTESHTATGIAEASVARRTIIDKARKLEN